MTDEPVDAALLEVSSAETSLEQLLRELAVLPRAEKVTVTPLIEKALSRVRAARTILAEARKPVDP